MGAEFRKAVKILHVAYNDLQISVGASYKTTNSMFPVVKILEINHLFDVRVEAPHPSMGHTVTPTLGLEEIKEGLLK